MRAAFGDLPLGARFLLGRERFTKVEHDLREGMLHCSNAVSDNGRYALVEASQSVVLIALPDASG